jgi:ferredoxin
MYSHVVIGTGPAGWASAITLIQNGIKPLVIDIAGQDSDNLKRFSPSSVANSGLAKKGSFGSTSMYNYPTVDKIVFENLDSIPLSSEMGGLSNVWGSNIQNLQKSQAVAWGSEADNMFKSITEILNEFPHSGKRDSLENLSSWPVDFPSETPNSPRMTKILNRSQKLKLKKHWMIGQARNATAGVNSGCVLCGKCLTGCPENVIFNTKSAFSTWINEGKIEFKRIYVTRLSKNQDTWEISGIDPQNRNIINVQASRVYLGSGAIASTILLNKSKLIPNNAELSDTQVFYFPLFSFRDSAKNSGQYALAQIFISSVDSDTITNAFHYSLYENSETIKERISSIYPFLGRFTPNFLLKQTLSGIGFVHPSRSGKIQVTQKDENLVVQGVKPTNIRTSIWRTYFATFIDLIKIGIFPLPIFLTPKVGSSYHVGVLKHKDLAITNLFGNIAGLENLFCIDATSLPLLPTGPTTLLIMGNSRRITKNSLNPL